MPGSDTHDGRVATFVDRLEAGELDDGLPLVRPTLEKVAEMLRGTPRPPDAELFRPHDDSTVTVRDLATYGVVAGCAPIQMPILVGGAEAVGAEGLDASTLSDAGSWACQWMVNGPIRGELDIRTDTGAFGPGFRANRTIGRALGLAVRDRLLGEAYCEGSIGNPMKLAMVAGENEERSPWEPYHVSEGFGADESTVTFNLRRNFIQFIPYEIDPEGVLRAMVHNTVPSIYGGEHGDHVEHVLHTVAPYNADELAESGMDKPAVKRYLVDNAIRPREELAPVLPEEIRDRMPPDLQYPQIQGPGDVQLFVIGGSGRWNAVGHTIAGPTTVTVQRPEDWGSLLEEYHVEREWGGITERYDTTDDRLAAGE